MTPSGLDATGGWVDAPTDLPGFGDTQFEDATMGWGRAMVGGGYADVGMLADVSQTGFERISTGSDLGPSLPGKGGRQQTDWRSLFNYQTNPTFWILVFALAAVGFIHARISMGASAGRLGAAGGVHV